MVIYGLSGPSGTGKSFRARMFANKVSAEAIIDDAILISCTSDKNILAGTSAKMSKTTMEAIKKALFTSKEKQDEIKEAVAKYDITRILILGTSHRMINIIAKNLGFPKPSKITNIEDIASQKEISKAVYERKQKGGHIIPVPTVAIQKSFAGYFLTPLRKIISNRNYRKNPEAIFNTIVRPAYSFLGKFYISNNVLRKIIQIKLKEVPSFEGVKINISESSNDLSIQLVLKLIEKTEVFEALEKLQFSIFSSLTKMTAKNVLSIDINII